ncbi:MAG: phosphatase PAP2 family protein [Longimicrobiales bacterium]
MKRSVALVAAATLWAVGASGQSAASVPPSVPDTAAAPLFGARDWALVGGFAAAQLALFPLDENVRRATGRMRGDGTDALSDALRPFGRIDAIYVGSVAAYALGRVSGRPRLADVGLHTFVSLTLANAITGTLKSLGGRARPWILEVQGTDTTWVYHGPGEWDLLAGWTEGGSRQSYPSGHTTAAFALATVLAEELGGVTPWLAYPVAAGVGWSRLNDEAHWATDVVMGALVGIVAGRLVVRYGHGGEGWIERTLLFEPAPGGRGAVVGMRFQRAGRTK